MFAKSQIDCTVVPLHINFHRIWFKFILVSVHAISHSYATIIVVFIPPIQSLLSDEQVASAPILILGNKIDRPGAASEEDIKTYFNLHGQTTGKVSLQ